MTNKIVNEILEILENQRGFLSKLDNLTNDQVNFIPSGSKNSIGILLDHITGSEKSLIQQMIFGIEINRNRDKEFENRIRTISELKKNYLEAASESKRLLSSELQDEQLFEIRERRGVQNTILWALLHAIEHNNYHIGQIYLLLAIINK